MQVQGFDMNQYDQSTLVAEGVTLKLLNSQVCEQTNSQLARIRTSVRAQPDRRNNASISTLAVQLTAS